jgi:hypothetical protein
MSGEIKKHRDDALASGVIIGYGIGLFTNLAVLLLLKEVLINVLFKLPESTFNEISTLMIIGGIVSIATGLAYEIYRRIKLSAKT